MTVWHPISDFEPEDFEDEEFLVSVKLAAPDGGPVVYASFISRWEPDCGPDGAPSGEPRFQGEWRHVEAWKDCEPAAFTAIEPYEPEEEDGEN